MENNIVKSENSTVITAGELVLAHGRARYAAGRTVASETGLPVDTRIEFVESQSRWTGTGYYNSIYRIIGTGDAIVIRHNAGPVDNISYDIAEVRRGYFDERKRFGNEAGRLAKYYGIPYEVCLALGTDESLYPWFLYKVNHTTLYGYVEKELLAGINRRKGGLCEFLGQELYAAIGIESMGQVHSTRLANYILSKKGSDMC